MKRFGEGTFGEGTRCAKPKWNYYTKAETKRKILKKKEIVSLPGKHHLVLYVGILPWLSRWWFSLRLFDAFANS